MGRWIAVTTGKRARSKQHSANGTTLFNTSATVDYLPLPSSPLPLPSNTCTHTHRCLPPLDLPTPTLTRNLLITHLIHFTCSLYATPDISHNLPTYKHIVWVLSVKIANDHFYGHQQKMGYFIKMISFLFQIDTMFLFLHLCQSLCGPKPLFSVESKTLFILL